jgi:hypothetical protein
MQSRFILQHGIHDFACEPPHFNVMVERERF